MARISSDFVKTDGQLWRVITRYKTGYLSIAKIGEWLTSTTNPPSVYVNSYMCKPIKVLVIPIGLFQLVCLRNAGKMHTHLTKTMDKLLEKKNEYDYVLFVNYQTNKYVYMETEDITVEKVVHVFNKKDKIGCVAITTKLRISNMSPTVMNELMRTDTFQRSKKAWWNGMLKWRVK